MSAPEPKPSLMDEAFGCIRIVKAERPVRPAQEAPVEQGPPDQELLQALRSLRLLGMAQELERQSKDPVLTGMGFNQRLSVLLEREIKHRTSKRQQTKLKKAGLQSYADIEEIYYGRDRGLSKPLMEQIGRCAWVTSGQDMLICGPTGTGKTYLSNALGRRAVELGHKALYQRLPQMLRALAEARVTGGFKAAMDALLETELLIIDDWGWGTLSRSQRFDLLEIIESRHGLRSTMIASQLHIGQWPDFISDDRVAESICDRLVNTAYTLELGGSSLRNLESKQQ